MTDSSLKTKLFTPLSINRMTVKNRIVMPPMQLRLGLANRRARAFYLERAKGGAGAIIICATSVDLLVEDKAWGRPDGVNRFIERMRSFTREIRQTGARIGIQLWHGNQMPAGSGAPAPGAQRVAPSATGDCRALSIAEIEAIISRFARAAETARDAGLDFVEIHGAHGYLPCQFFSAADNQRRDRYGGDPERRMQFGLDMVKTIRRQAGDAFPLLYRLGAREERAGGITLEQSTRFAAALECAGIDAFDVSLGHTELYGAAPGPKAPMGTFAELARAVKSAVAVPVMAVGRINEPAVAESLLTEEKADLIGIGRQLITDPHWPEKVRTGQTGAIAACTSCNTCFTPLMSRQWKPGDPICSVNARAGREMDAPD